MKSVFYIAVSSIAAMGPVSVVHAQTVGGVLGTPIVTAGNLLSGVAGIHHEVLAPTVSGIVPNLGNTADGVTNALSSVGNGLSGTGKTIQNHGLVVGSGTTGAPLVSVGATSPGNHGSVAALLNQ